VKTTAPLFGEPQDVVKRKPGGQPGNRNAFKTGMHTKTPRALRKQIARWKRETRMLLARVEREFGR
jgi:hypothetical protein